MPVYQDSSGRLLSAGGKIVRAVDASKYVYSGGSPPNIPAPWFYQKSLRLVDYVDGDLAACASCQTVTWTPVWDGVFVPALTANWHKLFWGSPAQRISGKRPVLYTPGGAPILKLETIGGVQKYVLKVECSDASYNKYTIWLGYKDICMDLDPTGNYTRASGCDATAILAVEWAP